MTMPAPPWRRAPRSRAVKRPLSQEVIVDAALRVLDQEGLAAVSMRRVAQELDTGAASLYAHVSNREELEDLVFDRIVGEIPRPTPDAEHWAEQLKQLMRDAVRVSRQHPGSARLALGRVPFTPNVLIHTETMIALLRCGGITDQVAAFAVDLLSLYAMATAFEESIRAEAGLTEEGFAQHFTERREYLESLPTDRFPNVVSMVGALLTGSGDERFEFGLNILIAGLAATVPK
jgi:AcrR family transcriptional regulator